MSSAKPILYSYYRSSCSWRVRTALALKGIDYEYRPVNLVKTEQYSEEFRQLNPCLQVPALVVDDNQVLVESMAIMEYLEDRYPNQGSRLLPEDPILRAQVRAVALTIVSGIQPLQNLGVMKKVDEICSENKDSANHGLAWSKYWIETKFKLLDKLLAQTTTSTSTSTATNGAKYCVGNQLTMADLCLVPQVNNARRFGVDVEKFPIISSINDYLLASVDAIKQSHPDRQPDCPSK
ncbi:maleylacetoacetate isomerase-like isoform X2 [Oppia nitens]|uniref:maleylacetoacetate isomerase-like isoform X2 n=1 Tax=Oppia nitens TaxID=1686743 RepID=UPI0023DCD88D|nr:maleylacetoacetate isomerase-like isoform X2 [Oppia nitens]